MKLELRKVCLPLSEFALEIDTEMSAERTAIFGPSGAGKTSLLERIAGLRAASCELVRFNGVTFADSVRCCSLGNVGSVMCRRMIRFFPT